MQKYIIVEDGRPVPITIREFRRRHPSVSFPAELSPEIRAQYGLFEVEDRGAPSFNPARQRVETDGFEQVDGAWRVKYRVRNRPRAELEAEVQAVARTSFRDDEVLSAVIGGVAAALGRIARGEVPATFTDEQAAQFIESEAVKIWRERRGVGA